jgi:hypothetical protein
MSHLISININKRLSLVSLVFIILSLALIYFLFIYQASFKIGEFDFLNNINLLRENYITESIQTIEITSVFFIIFLVALELFYNTNNFDAYFITLTNKTDYLIAKLTSYLIIILSYELFIFLGIIIIYLFHFKEIKEVEFIINIALHYIVFFLYIFFLVYLVLLLFHNYFSSILIFIFYWISKMIEDVNEYKKYIFLNVIIDYKSENVSFSFTNTYLFVFIITLIFLCLFINKKKDLCLN